MNAFDSAIYNFIASAHNPTFIMFLRICSSFGSALVIVTLLLCLYLLFKDKRLFLHFTFLTTIGLIVSSIVKGILKRPRPSEVFVLSYEDGYSFPNSPVLISTIFYGFIIYLILKNVKKKKLKIVLSILTSLIVLLLAISKISLGTCYASDVLGGIIIGLLILFLYIKFIFNKNEKNINFFKPESEKVLDKTENKNDKKHRKDKKHDMIKKRIQEKRNKA